MQSLGIQLVFSLLVAALLIPFMGIMAGVSALAGGMIATVGNLLVVFVVFRQYQAANPGALAGRMMGAEVGRLLLVAAAFALVFASLHDMVVVPVLFLTFLVVHLLPIWWLHRAKIKTTKR